MELSFLFTLIKFNQSGAPRSKFKIKRKQLLSCLVIQEGKCFVVGAVTIDTPFVANLFENSYQHGDRH